MAAPRAVFNELSAKVKRRLFRRCDKTLRPVALEQPAYAPAPGGIFANVFIQLVRDPSTFAAAVQLLKTAAALTSMPATFLPQSPRNSTLKEPIQNGRQLRLLHAGRVDNAEGSFLMTANPSSALKTEEKSEAGASPPISPVSGLCESQAVLGKGRSLPFRSSGGSAPCAADQRRL